MTRLVLLHGRDNQGLDPEELERTWRAVLAAGLAAAGSPRPVTDADATFVYYGDALAALTGGEPAPPVTVHAVPGSRWDALTLDRRRILDLPDDELAFLAAVATEVLRAAGMDDAQVRRIAAEDGVGIEYVSGDGTEAVAEGAALDGLDELGGWVNALLSALDHVPGLSAAVLVLLVRDVWAYLHDPDVRSAIDDAVAAAMPTDEPAVVVAHSLGSVVAYSVLREHADAGRWDVPLLLTLGSPLAIRAIRDTLAARASLRVPEPVRRWVAARDPRDPLALHGLGPAAFPLAPGPSSGAGGVAGHEVRIEDLVVANAAPGHHAAAVLLDGRHPAGYLALPEVARAIAAALPREIERRSPR